MKHTPTPWSMTEWGHEGNYAVGGCESKIICDGLDKANAEFIVRAVNAHEELVGTLNKIAYEPIGAADATYQEAFDQVVEIAKAALKRAKGEG